MGLLGPGIPLPAQGPSSRRGRGAGVRFLCSLPSAVLAAPKIKIKCGLGRGSGVGDTAGSGECWGFILSIVTSPPNLWHFNYSPTHLPSLGQRVSSPFPLAWKGVAAAWTPRLLLGSWPGARLGAQAWLLPPAPAVPEGTRHQAWHLGFCARTIKSSYPLLHFMVATVLSQSIASSKPILWTTSRAQCGQSRDWDLSL